MSVKTREFVYSAARKRLELVESNAKSVLSKISRDSTGAHVVSAISGLSCPGTTNVRSVMSPMREHICGMNFAINTRAIMDTSPNIFNFKGGKRNDTGNSEGNKCNNAGGT
jgi:hypothetical protein